MIDDEMARLDAALTARRTPQIALGLTIRAEHHEAAAAIARRHGYVLDATDLTDHGDPGRLWAELRPAPVTAPDTATPTPTPVAGTTPAATV